jgi:hypothetical protein
MARAFFLLTCLTLTSAIAAPAMAEMQQGKPALKSAGALAFNPEGILFVGDAQSAAVFAIDTQDTKGDPNKVTLNIDGIDAKVAAALGTKADDITINDLAVNPASGTVYLSVSRGRGPDALPVLLTINAAGEIAEFSLDNVKFDKVDLPNAPEDRVVGEGNRKQNSRRESITDLLFFDGDLYVAGLSNEEFSSKLRSIPYPFASTNAGSSIEIFHGSHGRLETKSPVRTFAVVEINDAPTLLAAYTCTPLVKIPVQMLGPGEKIRGETIAELGNHNRPLDMIIYKKNDQNFVLMANDARGMMKIPMADVDKIVAITEPVRDTAGLKYETLEGVSGVVQLDRLNYDNALLLVKSDAGLSLKTLALP